MTAAYLRAAAGELARIGLGTSTLAPGPRDRRFADPAWTGNPLLRRLVQAYLLADQTVDQLIDDADLDWRDDRRLRFLAENLIQALAPSNVPLVNPASAKAAIDSGGMSLLRGGLNLLRDIATAPRIPQAVDGSGFVVGQNLATTPGAVVLRTEVFELIRYAPQTPSVRRVPLLLVPPTINKFYVLDLAPGRSWIEHLVRGGQQVFVLSWRNPDARHRDWGLDTYVRSVLDALDALERICGTDRTVLTGACSGGILSVLAAAYLAGTGAVDRLAGLGLLVTALDYERAGVPAAFTDRYVAAAVTAVSRRRGYLDGASLAEVFAWLRPGDLVWRYWVDNYLLGRQPPAFDVLFWNSDTSRTSAALHADFVDLAVRNRLTGPGAASVLGVPVDLEAITADAYLVAGVDDHITPWESCRRGTELLGGEARFVLSTGGHVAALVNPPDNPKASYRIGPDGAAINGSWWPDFDTWLDRRCGPHAPPSDCVGIADAPGSYVLEK